MTKTAGQIAAELHEYAYRQMVEALILWVIAEMLITKGEL